MIVWSNWKVMFAELQLVFTVREFVAGFLEADMTIGCDTPAITQTKYLVEGQQTARSGVSCNEFRSCQDASRQFQFSSRALVPEDLLPRPIGETELARPFVYSSRKRYIVALVLRFGSLCLTSFILERRVHIYAFDFYSLRFCSVSVPNPARY